MGDGSGFPGASPIPESRGEGGEDETVSGFESPNGSNGGRALPRHFTIAFFNWWSFRSGH